MLYTKGVSPRKGKRLLFIALVVRHLRVSMMSRSGRRRKELHLILLRDEAVEDFAGLVVGGFWVGVETGKPGSAYSIVAKAFVTG